MSNIIISQEDFSNKRTFLPTELYLPEWANSTEFFRAITTLINYVEDSLKDMSNEKYAKIANYYRDIFFKYKNVDMLSEDALRSIIRENGYGLILDLLDLDETKLKLLFIYMPLFKVLKGTDIGYRELLKLISYDFEIETWIDNPEELDEYTYNITFITFLNTGFDASIVKNFVKLSRFYVYPVLKSLVIKVLYRDLQPYVHCMPHLKNIVRLRCLQDIDE